MSARIESIAVTVNDELTASGKAKRPLPWWGAGQDFAQYGTQTMTDQEALERSGLDWKVDKVPNFHFNPKTGILEPSPKSFAVVRDSDGSTLGNVGEIYNPFQNHEMIEFGSTLVDHFGAHWDTVGSLKAGSLVFASLRIDDVLGQAWDGLDAAPFGIELEKTDAYLLLTNTHDGSRSLTAGIVFVRVVCANTEEMAQRSAKSTYKIRHAGTLDARVEEARTALELVPAYTAAYKENAEKMIETEVTLANLDEFIEGLLPIKEGSRTKVAVEEKRSHLRSHILNTDTVPADYRLTQWGLLQGSTEFFEHIDEGKFRKSTPVPERRMLSVFDGAVAEKRGKALSLLS